MALLLAIWTLPWARLLKSILCSNWLSTWVIYHRIYTNNYRPISLSSPKCYTAYTEKYKRNAISP